MDENQLPENISSSFFFNNYRYFNDALKQHEDYLEVLEYNSILGKENEKSLSDTYDGENKPLIELLAKYRQLGFPKAEIFNNPEILNIPVKSLRFESKFDDEFTIILKTERHPAIRVPTQRNPLGTSFQLRATSLIENGNKAGYEDLLSQTQKIKNKGRTLRDILEKETVHTPKNRINNLRLNSVIDSYRLLESKDRDRIFLELTYRKPAISQFMELSKREKPLPRISLPRFLETPFTWLVQIPGEFIQEIFERRGSIKQGIEQAQPTEKISEQVPPREPKQNKELLINPKTKEQFLPIIFEEKQIEALRENLEKFAKNYDIYGPNSTVETYYADGQFVYFHLEVSDERKFFIKAHESQGEIRYYEKQNYSNWGDPFGAEPKFAFPESIYIHPYNLGSDAEYPIINTVEDLRFALKEFAWEKREFLFSGSDPDDHYELPWLENFDKMDLKQMEQYIRENKIQLLNVPSHQLTEEDYTIENSPKFIENIPEALKKLEQTTEQQVTLTLKNFLVEKFEAANPFNLERESRDTFTMTSFEKDGNKITNRVKIDSSSVAVQELVKRDDWYFFKSTPVNQLPELNKGKQPAKVQKIELAKGGPQLNRVR